MGGTNFSQTATGKFETPDDAFRAAQEQARWEHGHGGYTGTLAEKHEGFIMIDCPAGKNPYKLAQQLVRDDDPRVDDKWGPAGCIELKGKWLREAKDRAGLKGKRNIRAFLFFGWASC